jgi:hypothetical protein
VIAEANKSLKQQISNLEVMNEVRSFYIHMLNFHLSKETNGYNICGIEKPHWKAQCLEPNEKKGQSWRLKVLETINVFQKRNLIH